MRVVKPPDADSSWQSWFKMDFRRKNGTRRRKPHHMHPSRGGYATETRPMRAKLADYVDTGEPLLGDIVQDPGVDSFVLSGPLPRATVRNRSA